MRFKLSNLLFLIIGSFLMALPGSYEPNHFAKVLFIGAFIQSLAYMIILNWLSSRFPLLRKICYIILFILFFLETYTYIFFDSRFDPGILTLILQTSLKEVKEFFNVFFFNYSVYLYIIFIAILFIFFWIMLFKHEKIIVLKHKLIYIILIILFVIFGVFIDFIPLPFPIGQNTVNELVLSFNFIIEKHNEIELIEKQLNDIKIYNTPSVDKSPVIVLVIGESFNKNHSSLYGYSLPTSPLLSAEREKDNLIVFENAHTPTNGTDFAMRFIFTLKSCNNEEIDKACLLMPNIFRKAGYKVGYYDNQYTRSSGGAFDYSCAYFLNPQKINDQCFDYRNKNTSEYDGEFIKAEEKNFFRCKKSLNIIHLMGQHFDAAQRYPVYFSKYNSFDIHRSDLSEKEREKVAEYDNATLYNDYVISKIIDIFRNSNSIIIYLSDHGEQIYDGPNKNFGRSFGSMIDLETLHNVYEVPFLIWCSNTFKENNEEIFKAIKNKSDKYICIDDISYLLFELASIDFNHNEKSRSYINDDYNPHVSLRQYSYD